MNILIMGTPFWAQGYPETPWHSPGGHVLRTLAVNGTVAADFTFEPHESACEVIARISATWPVDLLYCVTPEHFPPPLEVESCPVITVAVISDWNLHQPVLDHNLARFDVVFSDREGAAHLQVTGAKPHYVAPIYSHVPAVHYPRAVARDIDVLFLGNLNHAIHRNRGWMLESIAKLANRYRIVIHGGLPPDEYATMLSRARIVINYGVRHEMNLRCFEAAACGALLMVEADNRETGDWLPPDEAAVFYETDEVDKTIVHYLKKERKRAKIAAEGLRRAPAMAMENRIDPFFEFALRQPRGERAFAGFDAETRAIAGALLYAGSHAEPQRLWALGNLPATLTPFDSAAAALARGALALEARDVRGALIHFQEAAEQAPGEATPWLNLAQVAQRAGDRSLEQQWLQRAAMAPSAALAGFFNAPVTNPWFADTRLFLAHGDDTAPILRGAALARLARMALEDGEYQEALRLAQESEESWSLPAEHYRVRGDAQRALGFPADAAAAYIAAAQCDPFDDAVRLAWVESLHAAGVAPIAREYAAEFATLFSAFQGGQEIAARFRQLAERA